LNSTEFGFYFVNYHAKEPTIYADLNGYEGVDLQALATVLGGGTFNPALIPQAGALATIDMLGSTQAKREYAEDIRMYGFSFNTTINETSVFGEPLIAQIFLSVFRPPTICLAILCFKAPS